ncbi:MAG: hypothetical protein LBG18_01925 [Mediterranea sp.]|jgi:hypothetical protein|nr:hypothetical protein [Mediterranea sp.]
MAMTVLQSLKSITGYPIPLCTLQDVAEQRGINIESEATLEVRANNNFRLAKADVLFWLADAPDVSQAGISYNFTDTQRNNFRRQATEIYSDCGEPLPAGSADSSGYVGERF